MTELLLETTGLKKHFPVTKGLVFQKVVAWVKAVDGVGFRIAKGETFGLVGESGCGKTTTSRLILRVENPTAGSIVFRGKDVSSLKESDLGDYRRAVQAVFQDPFSSLNPRMRVRDIVAEPVVALNLLSGKVVQERVVECLRAVGLTPAFASLFPHEFSGGQRQRIAIARALSSKPDLIVLDEPVSSLDVSIRAQVMRILKDLQQDTGISYLMIAHDLAAVKYMSNRIGVMYLGKLVETGKGADLCRVPLHPYSKALLSAVPSIRRRSARDGVTISGEVPSPIDPPPGCRFHPRCAVVQQVCSEVEPELRDVGDGHAVACHLYSGS